ncbi:MAG: prepilin-type N-terminal cleavage/methylation domain-containing protein [Planctomycetes bacterium]|nr:prepilin-type N-terminal cleavage/methylation domain-containing protein [Planctomycetota bacterium]
MNYRNHTNRQSRVGFTLIEILVVLAIIAVLVSLSAAAYQRVRITQMVRTSEQTVAKIQMGLDNQVKIIADNVRQEQINKSPDFTTMLSFCGGGGSNEDLAAAVLLHCRLRQYLPQTQAELSVPSFTFGGVIFNRPLAFASIAGISDTPEKVSAAALYAIITAQTQGGNSFATDEALSGAILDIPSGSGNIRVFKDGWGNPIPFVRFFQSAELDAPPYADAKAWKDPFDPRAKIFGWANAANKAAFQSTVGLGALGRNTTVLAYSAGTNKTIDAPIGSVDDIMGYRLRSIGAKGAR